MTWTVSLGFLGLAVEFMKKLDGSVNWVHVMSSIALLHKGKTSCNQLQRSPCSSCLFVRPEARQFVWLRDWWLLIHIFISMIYFQEPRGFLKGNQGHPLGNPGASFGEPWGFKLRVCVSFYLFLRTKKLASTTFSYRSWHRWVVTKQPVWSSAIWWTETDPS